MRIEGRNCWLWLGLRPLCATCVTAVPDCACRPAHCVSPGGKAADGGNSRLRNSGQLPGAHLPISHLSRRTAKGSKKQGRTDELGFLVSRYNQECGRSMHPHLCWPSACRTIQSVIPVLLSHCSLFKLGRWRLVICSHRSIVRKTMCL